MRIGHGVNLKLTIIITLILEVFSFGATQTQAQNLSADSLSLKQAIAEGLGRSPNVDIARSRTEEMRWKKNESLATFLPNITVTGTDITSQNYLLTTVTLPTSPNPVAIPQIIPAWQYVFSAQLPIFDGFASSNNLRASRKNREASQQELSWTEFQVEKEITVEFYRTLGAQILKEVAEQNLRTIEDHFRDVLAFKKAGISTNYDVLRVEVQVSEAKTEVLLAEGNAQIAQQKLAQVLGEESENRPVIGKLPILKAELISNVALDSLNQRLDITGLQLKTEGLELSEKAASRFWAPKVSLFGNYYYYNNLNTAYEGSSFRDAYQVGVTFTWNIFDGLGSISRSKESIERRYQSERALRLARLAAANDFELWKRKYVYNCAIYLARVSDVEKSEEAVRLAREGQRVGARTNTDILDAESELFRARAGVVKAQIGAVEALINLELTTGQRLLN